MLPCTGDGIVAIVEADVLWRRFTHEQMHPTLDRPQSSIYNSGGPERCISVHLSRLTSIERLRRDYPRHGIAEIRVADVQAAAAAGKPPQVLEFIHCPEDNDPSHAEIRPNPNTGTSKRMLSYTTIVTRPPAPDPGHRDLGSDPGVPD